MNTWSKDELTRIEKADELQVAGRLSDGALREPVTIWVVRQCDDLFVRSVRGRDGRWYRGTQARHEGHIRSGGVDRDVAFVDESDDALNAGIDSAYLAKYNKRYSSEIVDPMVAPTARATTMRLIPR